MTEFQIHPNALRVMSKDQVVSLLTRLLSATYTSSISQLSRHRSLSAPWGKNLHRTFELNPGDPGPYRLLTEGGPETKLAKMTGSDIASQVDTGPVATINPGVERSLDGAPHEVEID